MSPRHLPLRDSASGVAVPLPETAEGQRLDDQSLVLRVRTGDYEAVAHIFRLYYPRLRAFAEHLLRSSEPAEDVVQDVFVALWEHRATWVVTSGIERYLFGSVRNTSYNRIRHQLVEEQHASSAEVETITANIDPAEATELREAMARAIERLPRRCRAVYALRWYQQLSYPEIAHIMGVSVKTVEMHVSTALKALRVELAPHRPR